MVVLTFTAGTTPRQVILSQLKHQLGDKWFQMCLNRTDEKIVVSAVNKGIDASLEAITELRQSRKPDGLLNLEFGHNSLCVLLRRLQEAYEQGSEESGDFRSSVLLSIGIEEV